MGQIQGRQTRGITKEHKKTHVSDVYVHYLDCDDGFRGLCICQSSSNCTLSVCTVYCVSVILQKKLKGKAKDDSKRMRLVVFFMSCRRSIKLQ